MEILHKILFASGQSKSSVSSLQEKEHWKADWQGHKLVHDRDMNGGSLEVSRQTWMAASIWGQKVSQVNKNGFCLCKTSDVCGTASRLISNSLQINDWLPFHAPHVCNINLKLPFIAKCQVVRQFTRHGVVDIRWSDCAYTPNNVWMITFL